MSKETDVRDRDCFYLTKETDARERDGSYLSKETDVRDRDRVYLWEKPMFVFDVLRMFV